MAGAGIDRSRREDVDWEAIYRSPVFQELLAARRRVALTALGIEAVWFGGFLILAAYARSFMDETLWGGFSVAYALALSLILMTWGLALYYVRASDRELDPLARRAAERAGPLLGSGREPGADGEQPADRNRVPR
jgi:uncharacterized membrane protein (DUF485 family)